MYNNFGELQDMLALINSAVNFVLYCSMSQQFRNTFSQLFCVPCLLGRSKNGLTSRCTVISNFQSPKGSSKPATTATHPATTEATVVKIKNTHVQNSTLQANYLNNDPTTTAVFVENTDLSVPYSNANSNFASIPKVPSKAESICCSAKSVSKETSTKNFECKRGVDVVIELVRPSSSASSTSVREIINLNDTITIEATGNLEEQKSNWL